MGICYFNNLLIGGEISRQTSDSSILGLKQVKIEEKSEQGNQKASHFKILSWNIDGLDGKNLILHRYVCKTL